MFLGQVVQRELQLAATLEIRQYPLGRVGVGNAGQPFVCVTRGGGAVLEAAPMVAEPVVGNGVQPGREAGIRRPAGACGYHPLPDVLEEFVGQGIVAQLAEQVAVEPGAMARVQLPESPGIARRIGKHQGFVAGVGGIHGRQRTDWRGRREGRPVGIEGRQGIGHAGGNGRSGETGLRGCGA